MRSLRARRTVAVAGLAALLAAGAQVARGQVSVPTSSTTTTSTTSTTEPEPTTTSSTTSSTAPDPTTPTLESSTTTTTASDGSTSTSAPPDAPEPGVSPYPDTGPAEGGDDAGTTTGVVPPEYREVIASVKRSASNSTAKLLSAIRPLIDLGMTEQEAIAATFGHFPIAGHATFSHDWWFPRFTPSFHLHQGTDLFAATGTPVRAPVDGTLKQVDGAVGGLASYVYQADGSYFYMAHLSAFAEGQTTGQAVKQGDIVGYVGDSGNAKGGSPHVHFEMHPAPTKTVTTGRGKKAVTTTVVVPVPMGTRLPAIDPKPFLDAWLVDALANVPRIIAHYEEGRPRAIIATGLTRRLADGRGSIFAAPTSPPRSQLLWASSASPPGGALRFAEVEAAAAVEGTGYAAMAQRQRVKLEASKSADAYARAVLGPLTPPGMRRLLGL